MCEKFYTVVYRTEYNFTIDRMWKNFQIFGFKSSINLLND